MAKAKAEFIPCTIYFPAVSRLIQAAKKAVQINPANRPAVAQPIQVTDDPQDLAVLTAKYWGAKGVKLGVAFLDNAPSDLRSRILSHMNAWSATANVKFSEASAGQAEVRITRQRGGGYWSYLGTDILSIPRSQPTMNLDSFTMNTPDSEFFRVVRHETGHTLGFPHEHLRRQIVARLDPNRTIAYFRQQYGWSPQQTQSNVLTPVDDGAILATPQADETSIMAYQLPGSITRDGRPIVGGSDINPTDAAFCAQLYPREVQPPPPPSEEVTLPAIGSYRLRIREDGKKVLVFGE